VTTLTDRPNTALLVIVQRRHGRRPPRRGIANIGAPRARTQGPGDLGAAQRRGPRRGVRRLRVDELGSARRSCLHYGTRSRRPARDLLAERRVGHLLVSGAQTDACIRSTLHGALVRGYDATLVADAHTTDDPSAWGAPLNAEQVIAHTNLYWNWSAAPGRKGAAVATADVEFPSGDG
jgi:hypothetical protein